VGAAEVLPPSCMMMEEKIEINPFAPLFLKVEK